MSNGLTKEQLRTFMLRRRAIAECAMKKEKYVSIGKKFGISGDRVARIVASWRLHEMAWWYRVEKKFPDGQIVDPDGVGEYQQTYTAEDQYKEIENER